MENYEIYDKFYQPPPERNLTKNNSFQRSEPILTQNTTVKYLII